MLSLPALGTSGSESMTQTPSSELHWVHGLKIIQGQVGHRFASTTALYTGVSGDFMNAMMRRMLDRALSPVR